jgi:hypothetical protein
VEIATDSDIVADRVGYIVQHADQAVPITATMRCTVIESAGIESAGIETAGAFTAEADGAPLFTEPESGRLAERLFIAIHARAIAAMPDHFRIHAASLLYGGKLVLLVGDPHAGKSTLALRLLLDGFAVCGDELVLVRDGIAVTFPRKFYLRQGSFPLIPALAAVEKTLPFTASPGEPRIVGLEPALFARPWRIAPAPVGAIVYLTPDFAAPSRLAPCPRIDMVRLVMSQVTPPLSARAGWIGDLCATVEGARCFTLSVGDLPSAIVALRGILT